MAQLEEQKFVKAEFHQLTLRYPERPCSVTFLLWGGGGTSLRKDAAGGRGGFTMGKFKVSQPKECAFFCEITPPNEGLPYGKAGEGKGGAAAIVLFLKDMTKLNEPLVKDHCETLLVAGGGGAGFDSGGGHGGGISGVDAPGEGGGKGGTQQKGGDGGKVPLDISTLYVNSFPTPNAHETIGVPGEKGQGGRSLANKHHGAPGGNGYYGGGSGGSKVHFIAGGGGGSGFVTASREYCNRGGIVWEIIECRTSIAEDYGVPDDKRENAGDPIGMNEVSSARIIALVEYAADETPIRQPAPEPVPASKFDVFLSHAWDRDELGRDTHARVRTLKQNLEAAGFKAWFDEDRMTGHIVNMMARGIDESQVVLVFVTKKYMEKVMSEEEDNCKDEFNYAVRQRGTANIVSVVMEPCMNNTKAWKGSLGLKMGDHLYVDLSESGSEMDISKIINELERRGISPLGSA